MTSRRVDEVLVTFTPFQGHRRTLNAPQPIVHHSEESEVPGSTPGPEVIKLFSCSTQLSMKFFPLIHVKMPTIVGILTCMSGKNSILGLHEP